MAHRSPARWLAPIALVAFVFALMAVVGSSGSDDGGDDTGTPNATATVDGGTAETGSGEDEEGGSKPSEKKFYVVKLGDTPSQIADENGLTLEELQELNPDLDPQLMQTGDRIRLRR